MSKDYKEVHLKRRDFLRWSARMTGGLILTPVLQACQKIGLIEPTRFPTRLPQPTIEPFVSATPAVTVPPQISPTVAADFAQVAFVRTRDRVQGIRRALSLLGQTPVEGKRVLLKPNFNSDDPAPASTHPDTLQTLIESLQQMGSSHVTVADRSGMGNTRQVMKKLGAFELADKLGFDTLVLDELTSEEDWRLLKIEDSHWENGFPIPHKLLEADAIIQTCCLKPHHYGGHFTMSLKNSVGMVGKYMGRGGHNYMNELHNSPYQRLMIAEINAVYNPTLVVLDGVEAFIDKGPDRGTKVWGDVILAGTDRVAIDAVGLALLRSLGYKGIAAEGPIFAQEQIARAVELGLGIDSAEKIVFPTDDSESAANAAQIQQLMMDSG